MSRYSSNNSNGAVGVIGTLIVLALLIAIPAIKAFGTKDTVTFTITEKERVTTGSGKSTSSKYLIFTDRETFENTDSIFLGKFDSSDVYGRLKVGQKYEATVVGWRIGFLSLYRNIVRATPIE